MQRVDQRAQSYKERKVVVLISVLAVVVSGKEVQWVQAKGTLLDTHDRFADDIELV